jgi:nucleoside 2-deoxyribosyltransferase
MSEAGEIRELAPEFVRIAYEIGMNEPSDIVRLDQVAEHLGPNDLGRTGPDYVDRLTKVAQYLGNKGLLQRQSSDWYMFSVTKEGIDEVERGMSTPVTQPTPIRSSDRRQQRRRFLEAVYDLAGGSPNQFVYWRNVAPRLGYDADTAADMEEGLGLADCLANSGLLRIEVDEGTIYRITANGIDKVEKEPDSGFAVPNSASQGGVIEAGKPEEAPLHIRDSLQRFRRDYPDPDAVAFILMKFGTTKAHEEITQAIQEELAAHNITGVRADDTEYHDDLYYNVLTYLHRCKFGVAVFERIEGEDFNPNVALEVGYMFASIKPVCLLKDRTLTSLHADLVGKLYREFDTQDPHRTIRAQLAKWLMDKELSRR